jgi:hypothetical protein
MAMLDHGGTGCHPYLPRTSTSAVPCQHPCALVPCRCQPLIVKAQKLATGEIKPPRASARIQEAGFPAASAQQPAAHAHSNGGGGGAPNGVAPGARRQRTSYTSLSASAAAGAAGTAGGGGGRIRVRLGGAAVGRGERPATPDTRAGTPDTVSDLPSWGAPGRLRLLMPNFFLSFPCPAPSALLKCNESTRHCC